MPYIVVYPLRAFWNYCCLIINEKFLVTPNLFTQKYLNIRRLNFVNISLESIIRRCICLCFRNSKVKGKIK